MSVTPPKLSEMPQEQRIPFVNRIQAERDRLQARNFQLKTDLKKLHDQTAQVEGLISRVKHLEEALQESKDKLKAQQEMVDKAQRELEEKQQKEQQLQQQLEGRTKELQTALADKNASDERRCKLQKEHESLKEELANTNVEKLKASQALRKEQEAHKKLEAENGKLKAEVSRLHAELAEKTKQLEEQQERIGKIEADNLALREQHAADAADLEAVRLEKERLKENLEKTERSLEQLRKELGENKKSAERVAGDLKGLQAKHTALLAEQTRLSSQEAELRSKVAEQAATIEAQSREIFKLSTGLAASQEAADQALAAKERALAKLKQSREEAAAQLQVAQQAQEDAGRRIAAQAQEISTLRDQEQKLKADHQEEVKALRERFEGSEQKLQEQIRILTARHEALNQEYQQDLALKQAELDRAKTSLAEKQKTVENLDRQIKGLQIETSKLGSELEEITRQREEALRQVGVLTQQVARVNQELAAETKRRAEAEDRVGALEREAKLHREEEDEDAASGTSVSRSPSARSHALSEVKREAESRASTPESLSKPLSFGHPARSRFRPRAGSRSHRDIGDKEQRRHGALLRHKSFDSTAESELENSSFDRDREFGVWQSSTVKVGGDGILLFAYGVSRAIERHNPTLGLQSAQPLTSQLFNEVIQALQTEVNHLQRQSERESLLEEDESFRGLVFESLEAEDQPEEPKHEYLMKRQDEAVMIIRRVSNSIEIESLTPRPKDDQMYAMVLTAKIAAEKVGRSRFTIEHCEDNPAVAFKLYLIGKSMGLTPTFKDAPDRKGHTLSGILSNKEGGYGTTMLSAGGPAKTIAEIYQEVKNGKVSQKELQRYIAQLEYIAPSRSPSPE